MKKRCKTVKFSIEKRHILYYYQMLLKSARKKNPPTTNATNRTRPKNSKLFGRNRFGNKEGIRTIIEVK